MFLDAFLKKTLERIMNGELPFFSPSDMHNREVEHRDFAGLPGQKDYASPGKALRWAEEILAKLTREEKFSLIAGYKDIAVAPVPRLGLPSVWSSDASSGLRCFTGGTAFPAGIALAATWNPDLLGQTGRTIAREARARGISILLGPGINIYRVPTNGRNFEYMGEDPFLTGKLAAAYIRGAQEGGVITTVKHYACNNSEFDRHKTDSVVDERTLREIYLAAFEGAVKEAGPWTVMCSYNRINGVYAAENRTYLTDVLRDEWGFDGFVISDWGAVNHRVRDLAAGLELEMPSSGGINDRLIVEAVREGRLEETVVDRAVKRILGVLFRYTENIDREAVFDREEDHRKAAGFADDCLVLLKNENILPLDKKSRVAFIGGFAETPRYQGGGSSHINAFRVESALENVGDCRVTYARGFDAHRDLYDPVLAAEAAECAAGAEAVVVFAGLPDRFESEGFDRQHMRLPDCQNRLIQELAGINGNLVVVLHNGSPVEMPWIHRVKGVLEAYLGGQAVGGAVVRCLYGDINPSGRLAETFPLRLEDNPSYLYYRGEKDKVEYREGVFVGYRYYDRKKMEVLFPFGHGLGYTTFGYSGLKIGKTGTGESEQVQVSLTVTNTGARRGKEVVQLYIAPLDSRLIRPVRELKGFEKPELEPGESASVSFTLSPRDFACFNTDIHDWHVEEGFYEIQIGKSSRDIVLTGQVFMKAFGMVPVKFDLDSTLGDMLAAPGGEEILGETVRRFAEVLGRGEMENGAMGEAGREMFDGMISGMPLRNLVSFGGLLDFEGCKKILERINGW